MFSDLPSRTFTQNCGGLYRLHLTDICLTWLLKVSSVILQKACWYLNSSPKQIHPSLQCSFKLTPVMHSISLCCVRARVVTDYTEVFSGNVAKASVFDDLGWWLYPSHSVCFLFTEPGLCMNTRLLFQCTQNGKLADCEEIFSEFGKKCIGL